MGFSEAFRQLLAEKGMRQADFARATGWSTGYIATASRAWWWTAGRRPSW